tara:strand:+ start:174 stop:497 length:324 start_codon:yes stop_codon:yes gene_type:complete
MYNQLYIEIFDLYVLFSDEYSKISSNIVLLCNISENLYKKHIDFIKLGRLHKRDKLYHILNERLINSINITLKYLKHTDYRQTMFEKSINNAEDKWKSLKLMHQSLY